MTKLCFVVPRTYIFFNENAKNSTDKVGGAQKQIYKYSKELAKQSNFDVNISVADFGQNNLEKIDGVKLWNSFSFNDNKIIGFNKLTKVLKKIDADFYLFHSADPAVYPVSFYIKKILKKKIIYMVAHDDETNHTKLKENFNFSTAISMKFAFKLFDKITVQSIFQKEQLSLNRGIKKSHILPYIFDVSKKEINYSDKKYIFWIGRGEKWKRPEIFIQMAKKYPDEQFVMVMPAEFGKEDYQRQIKKQLENIENLKFINFLKPSEVNEYFFKSKLFLLTSETEGFANTMMESMNGACPILSLKVNPDKIITSNNIGLVANNKTGTFEQYFLELLKNSELRKKMGENGRDYLLKYHQNNKVIAKFIDIIQK